MFDDDTFKKRIIVKALHIRMKLLLATLTLLAQSTSFTQKYQLKPIFLNAHSRLQSLQLPQSVVSSNNFVERGVRSSKNIITNLSRSLPKVIIPLGMQLLVYFTLGIPISFAATKAAKVGALAVKQKPPPLWRKILEGANVGGAWRKWKPGDTRTELSSVINAATTFIILGVFFALASAHHVYIKSQEERNLVREVVRVKEYKENMYFDAVEEILTKLRKPDLKSGARANLQRFEILSHFAFTEQLKELDPQGVIQQFVEQGGPRPDITHLMGPSSKKKGTTKAAAPGPTASRTDGSPRNRESARATEINVSDDDDEDDYGDSDSDNASFDSISDVGPKDEYMLMVLAAVKDNLKGVIPNSQRQKLISYLKARIEGTPESRRQGVIEKIAERSEDTDYWIKFADTNLK